MAENRSSGLRKNPVLRAVWGLLRAAQADARLPAAAKAARRRDRAEGPGSDPGIDRAVAEGLDWLRRAQDSSATRDGGVARHFGVISNWAKSYPETTGYIVPTMLEQAKLSGNAELRDRGRRMLEWLVSIQLPGGGFQGGMVGDDPVVPVTFNTGQILIGLAAGVAEFGDRYRESMCDAADWLVRTQDSDGCWRKHPTPFAAVSEKAYETHVSWGLFEAARIEPSRGYAEAALRNVRWALSLQRTNGWIDKNCLTDPTQPLTHTIGYALRGVMEAHRFAGDADLLASARRTADGLLSAIRTDGSLPGRLNSDWRGTVRWSCLTGNVQIAHSFFMLFDHTGDRRYRDAGYGLNRYVRQTLRLDDPNETRGAVKGSFPVDGDYCRFEYPNWATKFAIDSYTVERRMRSAET